MQLSDPCIISGGTQLCDPKNGKILWQCNIEKRNVRAVKTALLKYPAYRLVINDFSEDDYFNGGLSPGEIDPDQDIFFADYVFVPDGVAGQIIKQLTMIKGITCLLGTSQRPGHKDIHITNHLATKEHAVTQLLRQLHVDRQNTWGFGDALNDVHLFNAVNVKVAMGNAIKELQQLADIVIEPVHDDGLAQYFEQLALSADQKNNRTQA